MKKILIAGFLVSQLAFAQSNNNVQPTPVDKSDGSLGGDVKGTYVEPTSEQKASVKPPVKAKKAKKQKKSKKAAK